jgi:hypothetical protein
MAGYEAGQKLIAAGSLDSNDPNLEQLLAQLKSKHYLDKQQAESAARQAKYDWMLGTVGAHFSRNDNRGHLVSSFGAQFDLSRSDAIIEGRLITTDGLTSPSF